MNDVILNDAWPSLGTVRRWGYDEQLLLMEQDEDSILGDVHYTPVLLELATDLKCPKAAYALLILEQYGQFVLEWRHMQLAEQIAESAETALTSPSAQVREWANRYKQKFAEMRSGGYPAVTPHRDFRRPSP